MLKLHKMLVQPLIENTLVHGFPGRTDMDEIHIRVEKEQETGIRITVEDNGVGMDKEMADMFNHYDYTKDRIESSIGLRNVIARLKLYYGEEGKFHLESSEKGTRITIIIPADREENQP